MKALLKFLVVLLIIVAIGGLVYFVVTNDNAANWLFAAFLCGTGAVIAGSLLGIALIIPYLLAPLFLLCYNEFKEGL